MSLNRSEQLVSDYVESHPEEKSFWMDKVSSAARAAADEHEAAAVLADQLWQYFEERASVAAPFREVAQREGLRRISMRNLAEYWMRLWVAPKPRRRPPGAGGVESFSNLF